MTLEEFRKRTAKFLTADEIADYETDYEPAYMAADGVDKDDFCAVLKDGRVKTLVRAVSRSLLAKDALKGEFYREWKSALAERDGEAERKAEVLKAVSLVAAMCDRVMAAAVSGAVAAASAAGKPAARA